MEYVEETEHTHIEGSGSAEKRGTGKWKGIITCQTAIDELLVKRFPQQFGERVRSFGLGLTQKSKLASVYKRGTEVVQLKMRRDRENNVKDGPDYWQSMAMAQHQCGIKIFSADQNERAPLERLTLRQVQELSKIDVIKLCDLRT